MDRKEQTGFTLYELMIVVTIIGVGLAVGVPNMQQYAQNSRMTTAANDLHAALHMARSEAPRAKSNITVCASSNALAADAACSDENNWTDGFIVFVDTDGDLVRDTGVDTETILRAHPAVSDKITFDVADENDEDEGTYFSFGPSGQGRTFDDKVPLARVIMCDERGNATAAGGNSAARLLVITPLGRATIVRDKGIIAAAIGDINKPTCGEED